MKTRFTLVAGTAAAVLALSACSSGSGNDDSDLGTAPVTGASEVGRNAADDNSTDGSSTGASTPSAGSSGTTGGTFADRAGIPPRRYVDAGAETDIPDQSGDGRTIRVNDARLSRGPGHLAIFTSSGQLLGSADVTQGSSLSAVRLSTPVPASGELQAVLFTDDGDGAFDITKDRAVNDGDTDADDRLDLEGEDFDYVLR